MSEIQWGFYHLIEDDKAEDEKFKSLMETLIALINPEAYKKYKKAKNSSNTHVNDEFISILMKQSGMTEDEAKMFMQSGNTPTEKGKDTDIILEPFEI